MRHFTIIKNSSKPVKISVPSTWADLTLEQYIKLLCEPETAALEILLNLPAKELESITGEVDLVLDSLKFLHDASSLAELLPTPGLPTIGASTYGQLVLATQYVEEHAQKPPMRYAPYLYALYCSWRISRKINEAKISVMQEAILKLPLTEVYADMIFYINGLTEFYELHADEETETDDYSDEEYEAGVDTVASRFGAFGTLDALSSGDVTKYEQVFALDADTALQKIRLVQAQNRVQRKLQKIHAAKA